MGEPVKVYAVPLQRPGEPERYACAVAQPGRVLLEVDGIQLLEAAESIGRAEFSPAQARAIAHALNSAANAAGRPLEPGLRR